MDYSEIAVTKSIKRNQKSVYNKRCNIIQADVTNMSMNSNTYDIVTAFETIYFQPDLKETFKKVSKIIKPNGQFIIVQETDGNNPEDANWTNVEEKNVYTAPELEKYLLNTGFKSAETFKKENDYIIVVIGKNNIKKYREWIK